MTPPRAELALALLVGLAIGALVAWPLARWTAPEAPPMVCPEQTAPPLAAPPPKDREDAEKIADELDDVGAGRLDDRLERWKRRAREAAERGAQLGGALFSGAAVPRV